MADCIINFINITHASFQMFYLNLFIGTLLLHDAIALASCLVYFIYYYSASFQIFNLHLLFLTLKPGLIGVGDGGVGGYWFDIPV
jgi:hypothetical protein